MSTVRLGGCNTDCDERLLNITFHEDNDDVEEELEKNGFSLVTNIFSNLKTEYVAEFWSVLQTRQPLHLGVFPRKLGEQRNSAPHPTHARCGIVPRGPALAGSRALLGLAGAVQAGQWPKVNSVQPICHGHAGVYRDRILRRDLLVTVSHTAHRGCTRSGLRPHGAGPRCSCWHAWRRGLLPNRRRRT